MEHPKSCNQKCEQINEKFMCRVCVIVCAVTNNVTKHLALESTVPLTRSGVNRSCVHLICPVDPSKDKSYHKQTAQ